VLIVNGSGNTLAGFGGVGVKGCVKEEERFIGSAPSSSIVVGRLEQLNLNMQAQSVCLRCEV